MLVYHLHSKVQISFPFSAGFSITLPSHISFHGSLLIVSSLMPPLYDHASFPVQPTLGWIELEPENIEALDLASQVLLAIGTDPDKNVRYLQKIRELNPQDLSILRRIASVFVLNGQNKVYDVEVRIVTS